ncbi:MAG: bifunctional folylpolyglutamate synthase/dihydrofolate synthase [Oscillospiraceae bacterium]|nr:bifunctional folylpolyglutamate synthase/dihydrofolate synthase [Oscillospiraceae bacterium]
MNYQQALDYIYSLYGLGSKLGLERIRELLELLGNPQEKLRFVHVAGTSGKGSATAMLASILKEAGYKTGMDISPFIIDFRERIQINGEMIPEDKFAEIAGPVIGAAEHMKNAGRCPTMYEVTTAAAMLYFFREQCDIVCLEVGLGGRLDSTNIIGGALVYVIMLIGFDHTEFLGDTIEKIAWEKCGIIKQGGVTVSYPSQKPEALGVIKSQCEEKNNRLVLPDWGDLGKIESGMFETRTSYRGLPVKIALPGEHQAANALTVLAVVEELRRQGFSISDGALCSGLENVRFPARLEIISKKPLIILDGAHNIDKARALAAYVKKIEQRPKIFIFGMLADKDWRNVIELVAPLADKMIFTKPDNPRAAESAILAEAAAPLCEAFIEDEPYRAIALAESLCGKDGCIIASGSLYMVSDLRKILIKKY